MIGDGQGCYGTLGIWGDQNKRGERTRLAFQGFTCEEVKDLHQWPGGPVSEIVLLL